MDELLRLAASAEQGSEHPLARAVVAAAIARNLVLEPATEVTARPGAGLSAQVGGRTVLLGTQRWLVEMGVSARAGSVSDDLLFPSDPNSSKVTLPAGQTPILLAVDGVLVGILGAADRPRPEAPAVLAELRGLGLELALLSGDRRPIAEALAAEVGITVVHGELLPADKVAILTQLAGPVAMVGDGINDAPALASASVGLAVGSGAELAAEAGDVVLMGDPLRPLPLLLALSRETVRIIWQNIIVFAIGVNLVGVVLTAWLWPLLAPARWAESGPLAGVLYHQVGSLLVLLNSMRLLAFGRWADSRSLTGWRHWWGRVDDWIARWLSLDEWLHLAGHHWRLALTGLVAALGVGLALSGLTVVNYDEVVVVRRFGRPLERDLAPGLHWRWPWPVEMLSRLQAGRVRVVEVGFRGGDPVAGRGSELTWASGHGPRRLTDESLMVTGDGNLVELLATVRYRVREPRRFLLEVADADGLIRSATEGILREVVAGEPFLELLVARRSEVGRRAEERLRARLAELDARGQGWASTWTG